MYRKAFLYGTLGICLGLAPTVMAQTATPTTPSLTIEQALTGVAAPSNITVGEMQGAWKQFTVNGETSSESLLLTMMAHQGGPNFSDLSPNYYTQGQTVTLGEDTYLVVYQRTESLPLDTDSDSLREQVDMKLAAIIDADTPMNACLLNLKTAGNLLNIRAFSPQEEIAKNAGAHERILTEAREERLQKSVEYLESLGNYIRETIEENYVHRQTPKQKGAPRVAVYQPLTLFASYDTLKSALLYGGEDSEYEYAETLKWDELGAPITYRTNSFLADKRWSTIKQYPWMVMVYEAAPAEDGTRGILLVSGQAKRISEVEWQQIKAVSHIR